MIAMLISYNKIEGPLWKQCRVFKNGQGYTAWIMCVNLAAAELRRIVKGHPGVYVVCAEPGTLTGAKSYQHTSRYTVVSTKSPAEVHCALCHLSTLLPDATIYADPDSQHFMVRTDEHLLPQTASDYATYVYTAFMYANNSFYPYLLMTRMDACMLSVYPTSSWGVSP